MIITNELRKIRKITPSDQIVVLRFYYDGNYVLEFEKDDRPFKPVEIEQKLKVR